MVFVIASYGMLMEYIKKPSGRKLILYYVTTTIMIYVHPTSIFNVAAHGLVALSLVLRDLKTTVVVIGSLVAAVLTFSVWYLTIPFFEGEDVRMWFSAPDWNDITRVVHILYGSWNLMILQGVLIVLLIIQYFRGRVDMSKFILAILWALVPVVLSIVYSHLHKPLFQYKYVLSANVGMILLLVLTIEYLLKNLWLRMLGYGLLIGLAIDTFDPTPFTEGDWREASKYITEKMDDKTLVYINPWYEFQTFAYYFDPEGYRNPEETYKRLMEKGVFVSWNDMVAPWSPVKNPERLFLIMAHGDFVQLPGKMDSLVQHSELLENNQFAGVKVKWFQLEGEVLK